MIKETLQEDNYLANHYIHKSNWLRAAVLGANDGILSPFIKTTIYAVIMNALAVWSYKKTN